MFKTAIRYVLGYKHRTLLTFFLILIGSFLISFLRFFSYGSHELMIWNVVGLHSGYVQIAANGWLESLTLQRALDTDEKLIDRISSIKGVQVVSPRIFSYALINFKENSKYVSVLGANPEKERFVTTVHEKIRKGEYYKNTESEHEANIGHKLARNLGMQVGDSAYLIGSQFDGSMSGIKIKLVGIFQASDTELDTSRVFINLKSAKKLFAPDNSEENITRYTSLALGIRNHREAELIFQNLKKQYPLPALEKGELREESENFEPVALNWEDLNPGILQFVLLDQIQGEMSIAFLILILAFGVLNTVQMSIQERIREFGSLLAIGTKPFDIQKMIVYEVLLILSPAIFLGNLIAIFYANYLDKHPIVLTGNTADAYADLGFLPVLKAIADPKEMWIGVLSLLIPSLIFTVLATRRLYRLNPVEIINS